MRSSQAIAGKATIFLLACALAGCSDFSYHRIGGVRRLDGEDGVPKPAPALAIRNAPSVAPVPSLDQQVKQATFVPDRPALDPKASTQQHPLRVLYQRAAQRYATMDSYIYRLKRREVVKGQKTPEEVLLVKVRRQPYSVFVKCLSEPGKGREVIYVQGKYKNQIQVQLPANDIRSLFAPRSVAVDDPRVRAESRHPITQTGFGSMIDHFGHVVAAVEKGDPKAGVVKYLGRLKRPEFAAEVESVHELVPDGDPDLPKGGERFWHFDADTGLPVLRIARDRAGREIEYYCHDHIQFPVRLDDDDFNADKLWRK